MSHKVVHFEVLGKDAAALQSFYGALFEWEINADNPMNYGMIAAPDGGIGGGVGPAMGGDPMVTFYVEVDDLQAALDKAGELGGTTIMPPMDVPGGPSIALFSDPEGNKIGLVKGM